MQQKYNVFLLFFPITQRQLSQAVKKLKLKLQVTTIRWTTLKKFILFHNCFCSFWILNFEYSANPF